MGTTNKNCTRFASNQQEAKIAKLLGGIQTANSGAAKFNAGDVKTKTFLIEAKTTMSPKQSFSIRKAWLDKLEQERMDLQMPYSALAFQFEPNGTNYFIVKDTLFKQMMEVFTDDSI